VRFDTNFRFTDKGSGLSVFVDGEGTLGLPEKKACRCSMVIIDSTNVTASALPIFELIVRPRCFS